MKSILMTRKGECYWCGQQGFTHDHHIFDGPNRKHSTQYGMRINLCIKCHERVHSDIEMMRSLQKDGQTAFEKKWGSRRKFREIFGRNFIESYIEDDEMTEVIFRTGVEQDTYSVTLEMETANGMFAKTFYGEREKTDSVARAEMKAMILGLSRIIKPCRIKICTKNDSIVAAINNDWVGTWKNNGWKNKKGGLVRNFDLWDRFTRDMESKGIVGMSAERWVSQE